MALLKWALALAALCLLAQAAAGSCYEPLRERGRQLARQGQHEAAINKYLAALNCPDKPEADDLALLIRRALEARVKQLEAARDEAAAQQQKAEAFSAAAIANRYVARAIVENEAHKNPAKALRYAQLAMGYDSTNFKATEQYYSAYYQPIYEYDGGHYRTAFPKRVFRYENSIKQVFFSPQQAGQLYTFDEDGQALRWDVMQRQSASVAQMDSPISAAAIAPDGQLMALGNKRGGIQVMAGSGEVLTLFDGHSNLVHSLAYAPNGKWLASTSWDGSVKVWAADGSTALDAMFLGDACFDAKFSADSRWLYVASGKGLFRVPVKDDGQLDIESLEKLSGGTFYHIDLSADGQRIAGVSGNDVVLFGPDGAMVDRLTQNSRYNLYWAAFSPDGRYIATGGVEGQVRLWSLDDEGQANRVILNLAHEGEVFSVAFSPDGRYLATASGDETVKVWDLKLEKIPVHDFGKRSSFLDLHNDQYVLCGTMDSTLHVLDLEANLLGSFKTRTAFSYFMDFGKFTHFVRFGDKVGMLHPTEGMVYDIYTPAQHPVVINAAQNTVDVVDGTDTIPVAKIYFMEMPTGRIYFYDLINNEVSSLLSGYNHLLGVSYGDTVMLKNLRTGEVLLNQNVWHKDEIISLQVVENIVLLTSRDKTASVYLMADNTYYGGVADHNAAISDVALHGSGQYHASSSFDNTVRVWRTDMQQKSGWDHRVVTLAGHFTEVDAVDAGAKSNQIASVGIDGKVIIWTMHYPLSALVAHIEGLDVEIEALQEGDY